MSGLKLNIDKTEAMLIGKNYQCTSKPLGLSWKNKSIKILGISLGYDKNYIINVNFDSKIKEICDLLNIWRCKNLTINGRILLAKSLCYSNFYHLTNVFPISELDSKIKVIEELVQRFIWNNKTPLLAKKSFIL